MNSMKIERNAGGGTTVSMSLDSGLYMLSAYDVHIEICSTASGDGVSHTILAYESKEVVRQTMSDIVGRVYQYIVDGVDSHDIVSTLELYLDGGSVMYEYIAGEWVAPQHKEEV